MASPTFEYHYELYNPGQYPDEMGHINKMGEDGWRVHTAMPAYNEIYILWEREVPAAEVNRRQKARAEEEKSSSPGG